MLIIIENIKIFIEVEHSDTIKDIKLKISDKIGIPAEQLVNFKYLGKYLDDSRTLADYNIRLNEVTIHGSFGHFPIFIKYLDKKIKIEVKASNTIARVKEKIKDIEGILLKKKKLFFEGKELEEDRALYYYKIQTGSIFFLTGIFIQTLTREIINLDFKKFDTLLAIKAEIKDNVGIPLEQLRLMFEGQELTDSCPLSDYKIREGCTLNVERNYEIKDKIDVRKGLEQLIKDNLHNYENPSNEKEFIENQIILNYIISEKYKNKEIKLDDDSILKEYPQYADLFLFYKDEKCKVYFDSLIDNKLFYYLEKYYFNKNTFKKCISVYLNINESKLNDKNEIQKIIDKCINKISDNLEIPKRELYVTNVRKNCLSFILFTIRNFFVGKRLTNNNKIFLRSIFENDDIVQIVANGNENDYIAQIKMSLTNFAYPENGNIVFNPLFNRNKGEFGNYIPYFNFKWLRHPYVLKNGRMYYYPNENCEGIGLKVDNNLIGENIFKNCDWCIAYSNLMKDRISYKINGIEGTIIKRYDMGEFKYIKLFFQCKVRISQIKEDNEHNLITLDNINRDLIPYRIIREHLSN